MILLRSFPLSLSILWRFLLVMPLWVVAYTAMSLFVVFGAFPTVLSIPVIGILAFYLFALIVPAIFACITMHPYLLGIEIGLRKLGFRTEKSQQRLLVGAAGYGLFETLVVWVFVSIIGYGSVLVVNGDLMFNNAAVATDAPIGSLSKQFLLGTLTVVSLLSGLIALAMRAALLPALANFVAGSNPKGVSFSSFDGFGACFGVMMLAMLMITGLTVAFNALFSEVASFTDLSLTLTEKLDDIVFALSSGRSRITPTLWHSLMVMAAVLFSIWMFCLQCASAALSYERRTNKAKSDQAAYREEVAAGHEDIGALLRSRMQKHQK